MTNNGLDQQKHIHKKALERPLNIRSPKVRLFLFCYKYTANWVLVSNFHQCIFFTLHAHGHYLTQMFEETSDKTTNADCVISRWNKKALVLLVFGISCPLRLVVLRVSCCASCLYLYGPFCHCALKLNPIYLVYCLQHFVFEQLFKFFYNISRHI